MAQEVRLFDDLEGGEADETVSFALDGVPYEIDLNAANAAAFRRAWGPWLHKARPATSGVVIYLPTSHQHKPTRHALDNLRCELPALTAVPATSPHNYPAAGTYTDCRPQPHAPHVPIQPATGPQPGETTQAPAPPQTPPTATDLQVREWAKLHSVPGIPARGRVTAAIRHVHDAFHQGDPEPWKELLIDHGLDPAEALAKAAAAQANPQPAPEPSQDDLDRTAARKVGKLSEPQQERLRRMAAAPDGRATSDGTSGDRASYEALRSRGLCTKVKRSRTRTTYEISPVGRCWIDQQQTR